MAGAEHQEESMDTGEKGPKRQMGRVRSVDYLPAL